MSQPFACNWQPVSDSFSLLDFNKVSQISCSFSGSIVCRCPHRKVPVSSSVWLSGPRGACCPPTPGLGDCHGPNENRTWHPLHRCSSPHPISPHFFLFLFPPVMMAERLWHQANCRLNYWWVTRSVATAMADLVWHPSMQTGIGVLLCDRKSLLFFQCGALTVCGTGAADEVQCANIIISQGVKTMAHSDLLWQAAQRWLHKSNKIL